MQSLKLLRELYIQQYLGYQYFEDVKPASFTNSDLSTLPSTLDELSLIISNCSLCNLSKTKSKPEVGEGDTNANIMFVSDEPSFMDNLDENELLNRLISNVLILKKEDVYITNILKCKSSQNCTVSLDDIDKCKPFLLREIEIVKPKIIIALGIRSYSYLTGDMESDISQIRGEIINFSSSKLMVTYHPNYLLRNPSFKREVMSDMLNVKAIL
jgi:DNA polymerase